MNGAGARLSTPAMPRARKFLRGGRGAAMTVVVFSVNREHADPRQRDSRENLARFDVRRDRKQPSRVPTRSGCRTRLSRRRWARARGHYRRFACGCHWRGEASGERPRRRRRRRRSATRATRRGATGQFHLPPPSCPLPSLSSASPASPRAFPVSGLRDGRRARVSPPCARVCCGRGGEEEAAPEPTENEMRESPTAPRTT